MNLALTLLILINVGRVAPLHELPVLDQRAQARAEQLCRDRQWSHTGFTQYLNDLPYSWLGENLAKDFTDPISAHIALLRSPAHRKNMQNPKYQYVGFGSSCGILVEFFTGV